MSEEKLLTVREVAHMLHLTEKDVLNLAESGTVPAYKVGGMYLRFKREQVEEFKKKHPASSFAPRSKIKDKIADFFYYNDFYILSLLVIGILLYVIFM